MPLSDFQIETFLGKGSYGKVYRVLRKSDGRTYALKEVNIKSMSHRERMDAVNEIRLLASVSHPNIIAYYESFVEDDKLCIVTEFAEQGDLFAAVQAMRQRRQLFSENTIWCYFIQICWAMRALHSQNILHRDLKSPNVFLARDGVKLGDLGVAKLLKNAMTKTQIGTPYYLSPEIWRNQAYNAKSDVWSLGCLLYELATLRHPFDANSQKELASKVLRGRYARISGAYSTDLSNMIQRLLNVNPRLRPSLDEILASPAILSRLELVSGHHDASGEGSSGGIIGTIRIPLRQANLKDLTDALPRPMYMQSSPAKLERVPKEREVPVRERRAPSPQRLRLPQLHEAPSKDPTPPGRPAPRWGGRSPRSQMAPGKENRGPAPAPEAKYADGRVGPVVGGGPPRRSPRSPTAIGVMERRYLR